MNINSKLYNAQNKSENNYFIDLVYTVCFLGKFQELCIVRLDHGHGAFFEIQDSSGNYYGSADLIDEKKLFEAVSQYNSLLN